MRVTLKTEVTGYYKDVMAAFDIKLFEALKPSGAQMEIVEFTGSKKNDKVHLRFNNPVRIEWVSVIVEDGMDDREAYFIDEGTTLPRPLTFWRHRHIVQKISENSSIIIDDIEYKTIFGWLSLLMYPAIYLAFYPRKKVYKSYFNDLISKD